MSVSICKQLKVTVTQNISEDLYIKLKYNRCESVARKVLYSFSEKKNTVADRKTMELFFFIYRDAAMFSCDRDCDCAGNRGTLFFSL